MQAIPRGPDHLYCPFWRKKQSSVCHTCPLWTQIRGVDPQTGEEVADDWQCAVAHLPMLMINAAQQMRQAGASADKVANEVKDFHTTMASQNAFFSNLLELERESNGRLIDLQGENQRPRLAKADGRDRHNRDS